MQQDTLDVLRHVSVHGTRTRAEVIKAFPAMPTAGKAVDNLAMLGYLADNGMTTPKTFIVTKKAKDKLEKPSSPWKPRASSGLDALRQAVDQHAAGQRTAAPQAHRSTGTRVSSDRTSPAPARAAWVPKPWQYRPTEYAPSPRPGAMEAFARPSRVGRRLYWPDGRVTDIDGNPVNT